MLQKDSGKGMSLFVLRFNVPVNKLPVMSGRSHRFLGIDQYSKELMCLLKNTTRCRQRRSNPGPLDPESDALPPRNRAPRKGMWSYC